ncbi:RNA polymerase sigma factor [Parabacteroides sp. FAFU027]|uniref:RNA polymerase sigma factor n=1 Tax=Parabacteroides sp. FAFU027 TaxID=2922715 RepID=UPI001FAF0C68|nr:RNA polymerase sigma factor [Parabacteroides sp. FAFU027]
MKQQDLEILINKCRKNDHKAFRVIVESYQAMVFSLSFRLLCNEEEAKDTVQETFLKVWMNIEKYRTDTKFSTWIYTITTNLCLDKLKSARYTTTGSTQPEIAERLISPENIEQQLINSDLGKIIETLAGELSPKQRVVFTLHYLEEIDIGEIAVITGMTTDKIKSNLFLARKTIKEKLEKLETRYETSMNKCSSSR